MLQQAAVAQAVERRIGSAEVTGPIPVGSFSMRMIRVDSLIIFFILSGIHVGGILDFLFLQWYDKREYEMKRGDRMDSSDSHGHKRLKDRHQLSNVIAIPA